MLISKEEIKNMKCLILYLVLAFFSNKVNCQSSKEGFIKVLNLNCGFIKHGTGDMNGLGLKSEYIKQFKNKLTWGIGIGATINDGNIPINYSSGGQNFDGSIRYTTAGFQPSFSIGYLLLGDFSNGVEIRIGALARYQSSSYYDDVTILYPAATGLPFPVNLFNNTSPQKTFAVGGMSEITYKYIFENKMILGIGGNLQIDSNGDFLSGLHLTIGLRL